MRDGGYARARRRDLVRLGIPFLVLIGLPVLLRQEWTVWPAMLGVPLALAGLWRQLRRGIRWTCEQCGSGMRRHGDVREGPVRFFCPPCDVIWDTGLEERRD